MQRGRDRGFTLLEVLVALAILGLAMVGLTNAATGGFMALRVSSGYEEALSRARSHLDSLASDDAFLPAEAEGDDGGGFHWQSSLREREPAPAPGGLHLYDIAVRVSWSEGGHRREVRLATVRAGLPAMVR